MPRLTKWLGLAVLFVAATGCKRVPAGTTETSAITSVAADFALVARVSAKDSGVLEKLLAKEVLPTIAKSHIVGDVNTYTAREGNNIVYVVQVHLRKPGARSPNMAFEILANGRSFEDARALQSEIRKYFSTAPIFAEHQKDFSLHRASAQLRNGSVTK